MKQTTATTLQHGIRIDLNIRQGIVILAMFFVMFVLPIELYSNYTAAQNPARSKETYTQTALNTEQGKVAGVSTANTQTSKTTPNLITIPVLNIKFDTTFTDPSSIPIAIGGGLSLIALIIGAILLFDMRR